MREIKFRAWDKIQKQLSCVNSIKFEFKTLELNHSGWMYLKDVELMQYTGLKDKNGVEIYEGDILASQDKNRKNWYVSHHEVVWNDTGFMGKQICSSSFIGLDYWTRGEKGYVVIGNIYENPELLEAEK